MHPPRPRDMGKRESIVSSLGRPVASHTFVHGSFPLTLRRRLCEHTGLSPGYHQHDSDLPPAGLPLRYDATSGLRCTGSRQTHPSESKLNSWHFNRWYFPDVHEVVYRGASLRQDIGLPEKFFAFFADSGAVYSAHLGCSQTTIDSIGEA